jgi:hypothetical protein
MSRYRIAGGRIEATEHPGELQVQAAQHARQNFLHRVGTLRTFVEGRHRTEEDWRLMRAEARALRDDMHLLRLLAGLNTTVHAWALDLASFLGIWDGTDGGVKDVIMQDILLMERELAS